MNLTLKLYFRICLNNSQKSLMMIMKESRSEVIEDTQIDSGTSALIMDP